jgi:hypothetical protein
VAPKRTFRETVKETLTHFPHEQKRTMRPSYGNQ